jgi:hypothetical protein
MSWMPTSRTQLQRYLIRLCFENYRRFRCVMRLVREIAAKMKGIDE